MNNHIRKRISSFLTVRRINAAFPYIKGDVLDLGCGSAYILPWLKPEQGYVGVEMRFPIFQRLRKAYPNHEFLQFDLDHGYLELAHRFDTILLLAVIEHLIHPENILRQIPFLLRKNGYLVVTTPTPSGNYFHNLGAKLGFLSNEAANEHHSIYNQASFVSLIESNAISLVHFEKFLLGCNQLFVCSPTSS
jgi:2-polyprenyl-3-methyl-5-hydroxy-6-metoxy-1,4-benzoquinol methylase